MAQQPDRRDPTRSQSNAKLKEDVSGPVPRRHRMRLGQDIVKNPQGVGMPSTKSMLANQGGKGW